MRYLDLDSLQYQRRRTGYPATLESAKRGAYAPVAFQLVRSGVLLDLATEFSVPLPVPTGRFLLKNKGAFDAPSFVVSATALVVTGTGASAIYTFYPAYTGLQLDAALSPNREYVDLAAEIELTIATTTYRQLNAFAYRIANSVNRGNESPSNYPNGAPAITLPLIVNLTGGVSPTDLDALALAAYPALQLFDITRTISGAVSSSRWQKVPGNNTTNTASGIIRTLDYNASTNPYVLVRVSGL